MSHWRMGLQDQDQVLRVVIEALPSHVPALFLLCNRFVTVMPPNTVKMKPHEKGQL